FKYGSVRGAAGDSRPYRDTSAFVSSMSRADFGYSPVPYRRGIERASAGKLASSIQCFVLLVCHTGVDHPFFECSSQPNSSKTTGDISANIGLFLSADDAERNLLIMAPGMFVF
ncbi:MAG TPA: hypothetical protein PLY87_20860, partial [Planctomycetaceae bacterium]|nr:hypothetical protein [Planctomycetaceae bacterium]